MKAKILWLAVGLFLSAAAVQAQDSNRWYGGSYDGWDRNTLSGVMPLAPAAKLVFTTQPGGGISNAVWAVPPVVTVQDAYGFTVVTDTSTVTLAIGTNAGPGGVLSGTLSQVAVAGVATFSTNALSIDKVGTGYTLVASDGALTSATSGVFNITAAVGPPAKLAFTTQPGGGTNHVVWGTQPAVTLQDAGGNTVTGTAQTVTLAILNNPAGGVLSGTTNLAVDVNTGIATFSGLSIDKVGAGYTLTATGGTLTSATSGVFNITLGAAAMLAFTTQPGGGFNDVPWTTQPAVTVQDASGNTVTTDVSTVTLAIGTNPGGGTLSGILTKAAVAGVANFSVNTLRINQPGNGYTLVATAGSLTSATSGVFNITVDPTALRFKGGSYDGWDRNTLTNVMPLAPAAKLVFTTQPGGGISNAVWAAQPVVTVQDAYGFTVVTDTSTVTLAIGTNAGPGGVLSGTLSQVAVAGVATFSGLSIDKPGAGYTLVATDGALTSATSGVFNINMTVGPPAKLAFTTQPGGGTNHVVWGTQPAVTLQDAGGNTVTGTAQTVTLAILNNPAGGVLSGTTNLAVDVNTGIATFSGLSIDKVGAGYTLTATGGTLTSATSGVFNITLGAAAMLAFTTQPGGGFSDVPWTTQPAVTVQDASGNTVTTDVSTVTLAIGTNPGGGTLSGILTKAAVAGVANFSVNTLRINQPGNGYTLVATAGSLTSATSGVFNIAVDPTALRFKGGSYDGWDRNTLTNVMPLAPAAKLVFTTQPGGGISNAVWAAQPVVTVQDAYGFTVVTDTSTVTLAIGTNAGPGGVLSGTLSQVAVAGVATFSGLSIDKPGAGYTLVATDGALTSATSGVFNINMTVGPPAKLAFTTQPGGGTNHVVWGTQPAVTLQDAGGNTVTGTAQTVTLAILNNPAGGVLSGTTNLAVDVNTGIATFSGLSIDKVGAGYTLTATGGTLTSATSGVFNITLGAAAMLAFTTQPGGGFSDVPWTTQPAVTVQDASGNTVTTDVSTVTLAIGTNPGGGTLSGILTKAAVAGVANFSVNTLRINQPGNGYTLVATAGSLTSATSGVFNITVDPTALRFKGGSYDGWDRNTLTNVMPLAPAAKLVFTTQPGGGISNAVWAAQPVVTVQDAYGFTVVTDTSTVTLAIGTNAGPGGVLSGTLSQVAVAGVATFSGLSIDKPGAGYTLVATDGALTSATSGVFNINMTVGPPAKLAFTTQPGGGTNHVVWGTQPAVTLQDAGGNTVTGTAQTVTLAILSNPAGGVLGGTTNLAVDVNTGIATFSGLSIDKVGAGYTLTATGGTLTSATSGVFNITLGAAAMLAFTTQPGGGFSDVPWTTQPAVTVQDASGNTVTTDVSTVTLAIGTNPGGGTLSGILTKAAVAGVANFNANALRINQPGNGYTLVATDGAMVSATSGVFNITVDPTALRFKGGSYDGWDRNAAAVYAPLSLANGTLFMFQ